MDKLVAMTMCEFISIWCNHEALTPGMGSLVSDGRGQLGSLVRH